MWNHLFDCFAITLYDDCISLVKVLLVGFNLYVSLS